MTPLLEVRGLTVAYRSGRAWVEALRDVDLTVHEGETYGLVGESGSGKSTLALAVMRYLAGNGRVTRGSVRFAGRDLLAFSEAELRRVWRHEMKLVPQNPLPSLNPSVKVGAQVGEALERFDRRRVLAALEDVGLQDPDRVADSFPHQLSGGMQQRVMIAMAFITSPKLLVMDEPTTNLDVTTEATILDLMKGMITERGTSVLYVSHSLGVVSRICDRVAVLYAGELVEDAATRELYRLPLHPYTRGLLDSVPRMGQSKDERALRPIPGRLPELASLPKGCIYAPRCPLRIDVCEERPPLYAPAEGRLSRCHRWEEIAGGDANPAQPAAEAEVATPGRAPAHEPAQDGAREDDGVVLNVNDLEKHFDVEGSFTERLLGREGRSVRAVDGVDLTLGKGRTLGLVGESGSGKSTLSRCIIGLIPPDGGSLELLQGQLAPNLAQRGSEELRQVQMVFQNSDEALNPYQSVGETLRRPLQRLAGLPAEALDREVARLLRAVNLSPEYAQRLPGELSGGERQRVAIARSFAVRPELLLLDESVSGLDVSVQAAILNLLGRLQRERGSAYLFISHDLAVVSYLADDIAVMYLGGLMEVGPTKRVLEPPYHPYTEALLSAVPTIDDRPGDDPGAGAAGEEAVRLEGEVPSAVDRPTGCPFHTRCPRFLGEICVTQEPPWREAEDGHRIFCHIPLEELQAAQRPVVAPSPADGADGAPQDGTAGAPGGPS